MSKLLEVLKLHEIDITLCEDKWIVPYASYPFCRVYYIYSGDVEYFNENESFKLQKDTIYIFPVLKPYSITHSTQNPLHCLWFHIDLNISLFSNPVQLYVKSGSPEYYLLKTLEIQIKREDQKHNIFSVIEALLLQIQSSAMLDFSEDSRLERIIRYINLHFNEELDNSRLAGILNFNPKYFIRIFKKAYGKTPQEYISEYRAFRASIMLQKGISISDTAYSVGFSDPKSFSRFFKKYRKMSPSQFKKSNFVQP